MTRQQIKASWPQILTALVAAISLLLASGIIVSPSDYETKASASTERGHINDRVDRLERSLERMSRAVSRTAQDVQWIRGKMESSDDR